MRWLRLAAPALVLAAWSAGSIAQQPGAPPAGTPPTSTPPSRTTPPSAPQSSTPRPATPAEQPKEPEKPPAAGDDAEDEFVPTEELQPDAAVTFPVDI
jgi:hypothetical protein